jgi:hypothetical protein
VTILLKIICNISNAYNHELFYFIFVKLNIINNFKSLLYENFFICFKEKNIAIEKIILVEEMYNEKFIRSYYYSLVDYIIHRMKIITICLHRLFINK